MYKFGYYFFALAAALTTVFSIVYRDVYYFLVGVLFSALGALLWGGLVRFVKWLNKKDPRLY